MLELLFLYFYFYSSYRCLSHCLVSALTFLYFFTLSLLYQVSQVALHAFMSSFTSLFSLNFIWFILYIKYNICMYIGFLLCFSFLVSLQFRVWKKSLYEKQLLLLCKYLPWASACACVCMCVAYDILSLSLNWHFS